MNKSDLFESSTDIPELLASGIMEKSLDRHWLSEVKNPNKRLRLKIRTLANSRLLCKALRTSMDKLIEAQMVDIKNLAYSTWATKRMFEMTNSSDTPPSEEKNKLVKELESAHGTATWNLCRKMELFFTNEVQCEYLNGITGASSHVGSHLSNEAVYEASFYVSLHPTTSMFFAMATQRCYLHTCGGHKLCTKTHSGKSFNTVDFVDSKGVRREVCIYSSKHCIAQVCEDKWRITRGKPSYHTKLAIGMYRRRGFDFDNPSFKDMLAQLPKNISNVNTRRVKNPKFVLTHPDIDVNSTQKELHFTNEEINISKKEVKRKSHSFTE